MNKQYRLLYLVLICCLLLPVATSAISTVPEVSLQGSALSEAVAIRTEPNRLRQRAYWSMSPKDTNQKDFSLICVALGFAFTVAENLSAQEIASDECKCDDLSPNGLSGEAAVSSWPEASLLRNIETPFDWYRWQGEQSAIYTSTNAYCGQTSVAMSILYAHYNKYNPLGAWVPISDIARVVGKKYNDPTNTNDLLKPLALDQWDVSYKTIANGDMQAIVDAVNDRGHIVIVPLTMGIIPAGIDCDCVVKTDPLYRFDRYVSYAAGHWLVVKGFSDMEVIVYDPDVFSGNAKYWYWDDTYKGRDRYYSYQQFATAFDDIGADAIEIIETPDDVTLFWDRDYGYGNIQDELGYRQYTERGWWNFDQAFEASSIKVSHGRSALLYEGSNRQGPRVCVTSNVESFSTLGYNGYFPGTRTEINDHVSSIELFDKWNCIGAEAGGVWGQVVTQSGTPVPGAHVWAVTWGGAALTETDVDGHYFLGGLSPSLGYALVWAADPTWTDTGLVLATVKPDQWKLAPNLKLIPNCCVSPTLGEGGEHGHGIDASGMAKGTCEPPVRPPDCPTSGGVILYQHANYDCGGTGEGSGYVRLDAPGVYNNVGAGFNDHASSVRVPNGWSVKLYQHENGQGGWSCRTGDDPDFWGDQFNNGVPLNDSITSFEVFDTADCGGNHAPNTPVLQSPADGYVAEKGEAPRFCWSNSSDPEGDQIEFYAEVTSPISANSGWIRETCWRPKSLDGQPNTYQWRVHARDVPGHLISDWSAARSFTIANQPPYITFTTANGSPIPASWQIKTNQRDWVFGGTASDPDGQVTQIKFKCSGDNCGSFVGQGGTGTWTYEQHNLAGRNNITFYAYDNLGSRTPSLSLDLWVDLKPPITTLALNGDSEPGNWPDWFIAPVQVRLQAEDRGTGGARAGVQRIRYRVDGGSWQTHTGGDKKLTVSGDGPHTVEYYAEDQVGNQESPRQVTFQIDATPPKAPGAAAETHGTLSGQWQRDWNDPAFTWEPASDATSGVWYYEVTWGDTLHVVAGPAYDPPAVRTGSYALAVRSVDHAKNVGPVGATFSFRYDGTPPHAPDVQNNDGVASGVWQNQVRTPDFLWPSPDDEGSGIAGSQVYWGPDPQGISDTLRTQDAFSSTVPICAANEAAVSYLQVRSLDNVGWASDWVGYALAYDGAPPTATLTVNYGLTVTHQISVHLGIAAGDEGSGVTYMRLSNDNRTWSDWASFAPETRWEIPAQGRHWHRVYLQIADGVGNLSAVVSDTVFLDVNAPRPQSETYWLWEDLLASAGGIITSTSYSLSLTFGQPVGPPVGVEPGTSGSSSANYALIGGYQAAAQAAPIVAPVGDIYTQTGRIVAGGGTGAAPLQSESHDMWGTLGQPAHLCTISSTNYLLFSGFWGGAGSDYEPPVPPSPPPPEPPPPDCEFYSLVIAGDAPFTSSPEVTLTLCGPDPVDVMLSHTDGISGAVWQPYTRTMTYTLEISGTSVQPRFVYARFRDGQGAVHGDFVDDIIYDPNARTGQVAFDLSDLLTDTQTLLGARPLHSTNQDTVDLFLSALDDSSGLAEIQISEHPEFWEVEWQPYSAIVPITLTGENRVITTYVRFRDQAGNVSGSTEASLLFDTQPPLCGIAIGDPAIGSEAVTLTVYLGAWDELSEIAAARVSSDATLTDAVWRPYSYTLSWPISLTGDLQGALYAQYRDAAGNVSEVCSGTYLVDTVPPVLYVEVGQGLAPTRTLSVLAYDNLGDVPRMHLSNDPRMIDDMVTLPYSETVQWVFDEDWTVYVQVEDSAGNVGEPYPAYAWGKVESQDIALSTGWNLISWPLVPATESLTDTLASLGGACDQAWTYDANDQIDPYKEWPGDLERLDETLGVWLHATQPVTLTVTGWRPADTAIPLRQGWNLVGYPSQTARPVAEALSFIDGCYAVVRTFDARDTADPWQMYDVNAPTYVNDLAMLKPGRGYWIYVTTECTWTIP